ncbi:MULTISPECIES: ATP-grasp domain-containing protein [Burkholderia]|uniref:ATP-grasp domain-containing protein n=1 Tax=Burkholderia TaxID=32008 RepID=UPI0004F6C2A5|nr:MULTISPECIES: ATP-grasp domain-containing protein [Burkholderia]AIO48335.1 ATP-grasp domain protein [Burkholderia cepacia]AMU16291.1 carbamoyl-phosphate synthase large subunit [Burkholderia cenocepacia]KGB95886.1 ATP-grasp domain protein [Burkholderia cepacia]MBJ9696276.1 ATP-grasp domain-containing protein [Burkholderia cenocepacia]MBN3506537.1 ATP-grasp domain-containing protein [Burkholderia cenocepacia]
MNDKINVLVFPCGSENASEIHQALRYSLHVELIGASSVDDHGRFRFPRYVGGLPKIADATFDADFARFVARHEIDVVFATHDTVHEYLSTRASRMGITLINGAAQSAAIARRKSMTYRHFADRDWVPRVYASVDDVDAWPAIVKPDLGQGGQGVTRVDDAREATEAMQRVEQPLLVEYLPGDEVTVDCFTDRSRRLLWIGPRTRERVKAGISMRSRLLPQSPRITEIAHQINDGMPLRGPWFFQLKRDRHGAWKLLEISCRVAGTMAAQRAAGINLPLMAIQDYLGRDLVALPNPHVTLVDRNIATRAALDWEYDTVCVDLDDTLILNGHAVPQTIAFLYQSVAAGKQVVLLTRHAHDVARTLAAARIDAGLFDRIIVLRNGESKADHVTPRSIFIDNHFPERLAVARKCAVPVFDVDSVEFLIR